MQKHFRTRNRSDEGFLVGAGLTYLVKAVLDTKGFISLPPNSNYFRILLVLLLFVIYKIFELV